VGILQDGLAEKSTESMPAPKIWLNPFPAKTPLGGVDSDAAKASEIV
jgi:hypothetical protein